MNEHNIIPYEILLETVSNTSKILEMVFPEQMEILKAFLRHLINTLETHIKNAEKGLPIVGYHFAFPGEVFQAYQCVPVVLEACTYLLAALSTTGSEPYYEIADSYGHPYHACTSQKGIIGMSIEKLFNFDVLATATAPCDNTLASYPIIQKYNYSDLIIGDMPNFHSERGYKYFSKELKRMNNELSKSLNQEPDYEKMIKNIELNNEALQYLSEINELKKNIPSPYTSVLCPATTGSYPLLLPKDKAEFFKEILEIGKKRYRKGETILGGEKIRCVFPYMSIFFDIALCEWLDQLGMNVLFDLFSYLYFDPIDTSKGIEHVFSALAIQAMEYPMTRQSQGFADKMIEDSVFIAKEYDAECAIFTSHLGCKQGVSLIQLVREALRDEVGIPMLTIDIDVGDKRFTSVKTIKREIVNFIQTLELDKNKA
jgi:benzoyl-CoA reductase/2-hydroxyglutaryl-CoA dehydratase subunit BcrC/BadD/HgdB